MRIDAAGHVGIGTDNPKHALDVSGSVYVDENISIRQEDGALHTPMINSQGTPKGETMGVKRNGTTNNCN